MPVKKSFEAEISAHSEQIVSKILDNIRPEIEKMVKYAFHSFANDYSIELDSVKKRSADQLNLKIDDLEHGRRLNFEFEGNPELKDENVTDIVLDRAKKLNFDANFSDISIAHRLPPKRHKQSDGSTLPPTIIMQFTSKRIGNAIYSRRKEAKNIKGFPVPEMTKLYINENLTHYRKNLFWSTKRAAKANIHKYFRTANSKFLVKKNDTAPVTAVQNESDVDKLT